jgi:hypothetical protein
LAISALKAIGKQIFERNEFSSAISEVANKEPPLAEVDRLLTLLFYAGAIGNWLGRHETYMQFYHRRDEAKIYTRGKFILHHALIHAWGMNRSAN